MTTHAPYPWLREISESLFSLEAFPEGFSLSSFPKDALEKQLRAVFGRNDLKLRIEQKGLKSKEEQLEGLQEEKSGFAIQFSPFESPLYWYMSKHDSQALMTELISGEVKDLSFVEKTLGEGFFHYFTAVLLREVEKTGFVGDLAARIQGSASDDELKEGSSFVFDLILELGGRNFGATLLVPILFQEEWRRHFLNQPRKMPSHERLENIPVSVSLEAGKVNVNLSEWKKVKLGDFLVLDEWSLDPETKKGRLILKVGSRPIFRGKIVGEDLKILEYPLYVGMEETMDKEEDFEEEDLYEGFQEEFSEEEVKEEEPTSEEEAEVSSTEESAPPITPDEIPIQISIEVAKLSLSAKELLDLSPGALIPLNVPLERGVDLVVKGKKIGTGELIKVGEMLGVRVIQL